jgi:hypothetical protein
MLLLLSLVGRGEEIFKKLMSRPVAESWADSQKGKGG